MLHTNSGVHQALKGAGCGWETEAGRHRLACSDERRASCHNEFPSL